MRRRSRLQVVARLARLEETRRLRDLARTQGRRTRAVTRLDEIESDLGGTWAGSLALPGQRVDAGTLSVLHTRHAGLRVLRGAASDSLQEAEQALGESLRHVTEARRRVRAIDTAIDRRQARERKQALRRDGRRIDEANRGRAAQSERVDA